MSTAPLLLAVPNVSEGGDPALLEELARAFSPARLLDLHADPDHGRAVLSLAGVQGELAAALVRGVAAALERIDIRGHAGLHPHVGAVDVLPVVHVDDERRGAACAELLTAAGTIGDELALPVFLYGALATAPERRERAFFRRGGLEELTRRMARGELQPDYGPGSLHQSAGALLAAARPPLVAFNLELASDDLELARRVAAVVRESGGGLPGVRAIGLYLPARGRAQVSTNVQDALAVPLRAVVEEVARHAEVAGAELVGLAPAAALEGFPPDVPLLGFDPERQVLERALG